jgi:hypothetical protein
MLLTRLLRPQHGDASPASWLGLNFDPATDMLGAGLHDPQAEMSTWCRLRNIEAPSIIFHGHKTIAIISTDLHTQLLSIGMASRIDQCLAGDAVNLFCNLW